MLFSSGGPTGSGGGRCRRFGNCHSFSVDSMRGFRYFFFPRVTASDLASFKSLPNASSVGVVPGVVTAKASLERLSMPLPARSKC